MEKAKQELVIYKNEFNTVPLRNFTSTEMDLLFTIMSQMRDKGTSEVDFTFSDLKHLSNYGKENSIKSFVSDLERTYDKLIQLNVKVGTPEEWTKFVFFTEYSVSETKQTIKIAVNHKFTHLINELTGNFTKLELEEVTQLNSNYSKSCYRLLKQYRKTGYYRIDINTFRNLLDVPESYDIGNFTKRVLHQIEKELPKYFKKLEVTKAKGTRDKRKVTHLEFRFAPETDINKKGFKTFRNKDTGEYKEKHLYDFTDEDIRKTFPDVIDGQLELDY